jgi:hypothetical protein
VRIADAELALVLRARELFHADEDHIEEEQALDEAMYALHALRSALELSCRDGLDPNRRQACGLNVLQRER